MRGIRHGRAGRREHRSGGRRLGLHRHASTPLTPTCPPVGGCPLCRGDLGPGREQQTSGMRGIRHGLTGRREHRSGGRCPGRQLLRSIHNHDRCLSQRWQRGGNASNCCTVLSLLGASSAFMGSLASGPVADFILEDFQKFHIDVSLVSEHAQCVLPTSVVVSSISTGSRTILHMNSFIMADFSQRAIDVSGVVWQAEGQTPSACCVVCPSSGSRTVVLSDTNLPDVTVEDFSIIDLAQFSWIHWEGRNAEEQVKMIQQVGMYNSTLPQQQKITVSVEIEKTRETLYQLFPHGDLVFVSKDVARHLGFLSAEAAVRGLYSRVKPGAVLVCAWAEKGADALGPDGLILHSDAFPPETLVDTLGAGDTFNAAVIFTLSNGGSLQEALTFGCQVAGRKCGIHGYDGIAGKFDT